MAASYNRYLHWFVVLAAFLAVGWTILGERTLVLRVFQSSRWLAFLDASLAPLVFAALVALAVSSSESWRRGPSVIIDSGWPSLGSLSVTAAGLILADNIFGAAFRHQFLGPVLHIAGAMAGGVVVVMLSIFILTQHSSHKSLRQSAMALLVVTSVEVFLGIAEYLMRLWSVGTASTSWSGILLSGVHEALGALTLAASFVVAIQVSRNVRKPAVIPVSSPHTLGTI